MSILPLEAVRDAADFGGKAAALGAAVRAGLPVPKGHGVSVAALAALERGDAAARDAASALVGSLAPPLAARSSAVGEDAEDASFAGQHATVLNLRDAGALLAGLRTVYASAHSEAALAYRRRKGITAPVRIAAVVQELVASDTAGVLFTRNPVTHARERVIEAAWGLGETVVQGLVTPDHYRVSPDGRVLDARAGEKDVAIVRGPGGGVLEEPVPESRVHARCLDDGALRALHALAAACERHFGPDLDLEWAFAGGRLYLLQARPISTRTA